MMDLVMDKLYLAMETEFKWTLPKKTFCLIQLRADLWMKLLIEHELSYPGKVYLWMELLIEHKISIGFLSGLYDVILLTLQSGTQILERRN